MNRASVLALLALGASGFAQAHTLGASHLTLDSEPDEPRISGEWQIAIGDLHESLDLDANDDGLVTAGELEAQRGRIAEQVLPRLQVSRGGKMCVLESREQLVNERSDGFYAVLRLDGRCSATGGLGIEYRFLFDVDRTHRAVVRLRQGNDVHAIVLSPDAARWHESGPSRWRAFASFVRQGMHHIWIGYDHIAFLVLLLLPAVLRPRIDAWEGATDLRVVTLRILRIVTAFTAAHSITLSLAALGVLVPPERPIEILIAASVVAAGVLNLVPRLAVHGAWIAFSFGLIHGFGFANVLRELGLPPNTVAASLAGFNVGVEAGQLAIVAILLPLVYRLRSAPFYQRRFVPAASLAAAMLALGWLLERTA
jgi:hypothetical protein